VHANLTGSGMSLETADRWLDAWELEATGRGLARDAASWQAAEGMNRSRAGCTEAGLVKPRADGTAGGGGEGVSNPGARSSHGNLNLR